MVIVSTILYVDMLRFANSFSAQLNDYIILVINWIFCIFVFIINLAIAIYGFVCGCCYSKEFEKIIQNEQPKSAFSFTTSNKVPFFARQSWVLSSHSLFLVTLMLVTDVGDEMCWRQLWDVGDGFGRFCHQHPLSFNINVNCHQDKVTNIHLD